MPSLFDPLDVGALRLDNRIVMAPLTRQRAGEDGVPTELHAEHYAQRATAGPVSYTHLTLPTTSRRCRSRWSPYH